VCDSRGLDVEAGQPTSGGLGKGERRSASSAANVEDPAFRVDTEKVNDLRSQLRLGSRISGGPSSPAPEKASAPPIRKCAVAPNASETGTPAFSFLLPTIISPAYQKDYHRSELKRLDSAAPSCI
jgi:hypothetical protein